MLVISCRLTSGIGPARNWPPWRLLLLLGVCSLGLETLEAQNLVSLLEQNRHTLQLDEQGRLSGDGADVLLSAGRQAQFFLVGEEHGVAEIPSITAAIFQDLVGHGYRYLAIEIGDGLAEALNRVILQDTTGEAYLKFLEAYWPGAPFFMWREEADLLRAAVKAGGGRRDVLWGLDYDILADRYALRRLREIAPNDMAAAVADSVIEQADAALDRALEEGNPALAFMFGGPGEVYPKLRQAYQPQPGSEADQIISLMEETLAINKLFFSRQGYASNKRRALLNKRRFWRYLREAAGGGELPRVLLKFGSNHMMRGRTFTNVYDLGNLASEIADEVGRPSFSVLMVGGAGSMRAVLDPTAMKTVEGPAQFVAADWMGPFLEASKADEWTLFDLRPLRPEMGRIKDLPDRTVQVVFGFDALLILGGSQAQSSLLSGARPAN